MKISVLGLGAMGSRMAANLLKGGHTVTVWNRTPAAATALVEAGARLATTPKDATSDADFAVSMVRDDEASRALWLTPETGALAGMRPATVAIESSTLTPRWTRELGATVVQHGVEFLEAPVAGSRPQAEAAQLIYLVGGDAATLRRAEPVLKLMGSSIHHTGTVGSGALAKLAANVLMGVQLTSLAEILGMIAHAGIDPNPIVKALSGTPAWSPAATNLVAAMLSRDFAPRFPIELIEKDFGYALDTASSPDAAPTIAAARSVFRSAIEHGFSADNMTSVVRLFTEPR